MLAFPADVEAEVQAHALADLRLTDPRHLSHGPDTAMTQQSGVSRQLTSQYHAAAWRPRKAARQTPGS